MLEPHFTREASFGHLLFVSFFVVLSFGQLPEA